MARQTMPSPRRPVSVLTGNASAYPYDRFYGNDDELTDDIVIPSGHRRPVCRRLPQCTVRRLHGPAYAIERCVNVLTGVTRCLRLRQENLDVINAVIADQPDDWSSPPMCAATTSTHLVSGGGAPVSAKLFGEEHVDATILSSTMTVPAISRRSPSFRRQEGRARSDHQRSRTSKIRTISAHLKRPSTFRWTACACPPSAVSPEEGNVYQDQQWAKIAPQSVGVWG